MSIAIFLSIVGMWSPGTFAGQPLTRRAAQEELSQVLQSEADGIITNRAARLKDALIDSKWDDLAHWQAGEVRGEKGWMAYDQLLLLDTSLALRKEYRQRRQKTPETLEGQLQLAGWCRTHKLPDQERVHLLKALKFRPMSSELRTRLGHQFVGGSWLSPQQQQRLDEEKGMRAAALKEWAPRLTKLRDGLHSRSKRRQRLATRQLAAITDVAAVYAMEQLFLRGVELEELVAVRALGEITAYQAAHALVDVAVESNNSLVRNAAIEALKAKPHKHTVPELLARLSDPTETAFVTRFHYSGAFIRQVYYRERQYRRQAAIVDTTLQGGRPGTGRRGGAFYAKGTKRFVEDLARQQAELARQLNKQSENSNARIYTVLAAISDAEVSNTPEKWWSWWNLEQDTGVTEKPYEYYYEHSRERLVEFPEKSILEYPRTVSCFRAGTPVWTDEGFVAIEKIRAGDRVLSKNVETGELMYKPVLQPTERTEQKLKTIILSGGETLDCTNGHLFWRSGMGWMKAKDLKQGDLLHSVTGAQSVDGMTNGPIAKVYNLIVADFNTYFVGHDMVLSHDNTIRKPTNAVVPGLMRKELRAP
ncbi:polymorphic toxin-type HINT domain-containing protein [Symmachiella dynata]|uniref:polymorphic toxin-type HINT domain-containing protein n=1 Tax=Symmachiella dynata TaxID=2527995 RepID=UPI0018D2B286|nr:polymorphic toxin-type HINT domain-containing protein [Symmachiella dynata]